MFNFNKHVTYSYKQVKSTPFHNNTPAWSQNVYRGVLLLVMGACYVKILRTTQTHLNLSQATRSYSTTKQSAGNSVVNPSTAHSCGPPKKTSTNVKVRLGEAVELE